MKLSLNNFLYGLKHIVMDDNEESGGFLRDLLVPLSAFDVNVSRHVNTSDAGVAEDPVVETGAYLAADETNARVIHVDEGTDSIGHLSLPIPRDYDEALDHLKVRVLASQVSVTTDDDVELDSELYVKVPGSALSADKDPAAPGTVLSTTEQWIEFDLSGNDLTRDDAIIWELITNGANDTNGEEVLIHAIEVEYRSTLVSYNEQDSDNNDLR